MDEREAREWLLKRRGGLGKNGTDPPDWGSDLADLMARDVLAKAAYERRETWTMISLRCVGVVLLGAMLWFGYEWLFNHRSGTHALMAGVALAVFVVIHEKAQDYFDLRDGIYY
jgi:hypothetical protein